MNLARQVSAKGPATAPPNVTTCATHDASRSAPDTPPTRAVCTHCLHAAVPTAMDASVGASSASAARAVVQ